jgi:DNA-binding XRE family transcriptional regulator
MEGLKNARLRLTAVRGHYVTPEELGKDVGVSGQTIRNYEDGSSEPNFEMVEKLAAVTGVELVWPPFADTPVDFVPNPADEKKKRG